MVKKEGHTKRNCKQTNTNTNQLWKQSFKKDINNIELANTEKCRLKKLVIDKENNYYFLCHEIAIHYYGLKRKCAIILVSNFIDACSKDKLIFQSDQYFIEDMVLWNEGLLVLAKSYTESKYDHLELGVVTKDGRCITTHKFSNKYYALSSLISDIFNDDYIIGHMDFTQDHFGNNWIVHALSNSVKKKDIAFENIILTKGTLNRSCCIKHPNKLIIYLSSRLLGEPYLWSIDYTNPSKIVKKSMSTDPRLADIASMAIDNDINILALGDHSNNNLLLNIQPLENLYHRSNYWQNYK